MEVEGQERHWASAGDVIVLPYGDQHRMGGVGESELVPLLTFMKPPPWPTMPLLRHGSDGALTDIVCGYLHSDDVLFDPALRAFPPAFVVRPEGTAGAAWVRANIDFALAQADASPLGPDAINTRLPEMLLVEVLRQHLATAPAVDRGWLAALHDPVLNPALAAIHAEPERKWTVTDLARVAAVSRSGLDERFRQVLGPLAHPLSHRVADAPRRGPARLDGPRRRGDLPAGRVRRRGGVQPSLQARARCVTRAVAVASLPPPRLTPHLRNGYGRTGVARR